MNIFSKTVVLTLLAAAAGVARAQEVGPNPQDTVNYVSNTFDYVCETPAVVFLVNPVLANSSANPYTIWELRRLTTTAAGQAEADRVQRLCPDLQLEGLTHYYVKQLFDIDNNRTKTLAFYFFKDNKELGSRKFSADLRWTPVYPETVAEMEMAFVRRAFGR